MVVLSNPYYVNIPVWGIRAAPRGTLDGRARRPLYTARVGILLESLLRHLIVYSDPDTMRFLIFLALSLLLPPHEVRANGLCAYVLEHLANEQELKDINRHYREQVHADFAADYVVRYALAGFDGVRNKELMVSSPNADPYRSLIIAVDSPKKTAHSRNNRMFNDDALQILELPQNRHQTVWAHLTNEQRLRLVGALWRVFASGTYDHSLTPSPSTNLNPLEDALVAGQTQLGKGRIVTTGLDPKAVLAAAYLGKPVGVCRQSNCALAGLLGELGALAKDIKLVIGGNGVKHHIWLEFRTDEGEKWHEADATAQQRNPADYYGPITSDEKISRRVIYPKNQTEITDFLVPKFRK